MYVQTQTLAEMAPSKDSIDPEDPTTTWVTTKSILLSETFPMEFTRNGRAENFDFYTPSAQIKSSNDERDLGQNK